MNIPRIVLTVSLGIIIASQLGAGCENTVVYNEHPNHRPVYVEQPAPVYVEQPPPVYVQQPPRVYQEQGPVIIEEPPPVVIRPGNPWPRNAVIVKEGQGGMTWQSETHGVAYFVDAGQNRCVASIEMQRGDNVRIEPRQDRILVNNQVVFHENLRGEAQFQILFAAYGGGGRRGGGGPPPGRGDGGGGGRNPGPFPPGPPPVAQHPWPNSASLVAEGQGGIRWQATGSGEVYVIDAGTNQVVYRVVVQRNQLVVVEPRQDRILLDNRVVFSQNMRAEARHQMYFDPSGPGGPPGRGQGADPAPGSGGSWPRDAAIVADGQGGIRWQATGDGEVYVVDAGQNTLVYRVAVRRNQLIVVEPRQDRILLDNRVVFSQNMRGEARHQILYARAR